MNRKTTVFMLAVLAVLVLLALVAKENEEEPTGPEDAFPGFLAEDVEGLAFAVGGSPVALRREEGGTGDWLVEVGGAAVPADGNGVEEILAEIGRTGVLRRISGEEVSLPDRKSWGLAGSAVWVEVAMRGERRRLVLGGPGVIRDTTYASRDGEEDVLLVDKSLLDTLAELSPEGLRKRRLVDWSMYDIEAVALVEGEETRFAASRDEDDSTIWIAERPFEDFLDPERMEADVLPAVVDLTASDFVKDGVEDGELPTWGLDRPRCEIRVTREKPDGTQEEAGILLGSAVEGQEGKIHFMLRGQPFVYAGFARQLLKLLEEDPGAWRDRNLTRMGWKPVGRIVLELGDEKAVLERNLAEWEQVEPERRTVDQDAVEDYLETLRELTVQGFLDGEDEEALGLTEGRGRLTLLAPFEEDPEDPAKQVEVVARIVLGNALGDGSGVAALVEDRHRVVRAGPELVGLMERGPYRFLAKEVFPEGAGSRDVVSLERRFAGKEEVLTAGIAELTAAVLDLRAVRWVGAAEGREAEYGLEDGTAMRFVLTLEERGGADTDPTTLGVIVGAETEGGRYARPIRDGEPGAEVFVLSPVDLALLEAEAGPEDGGD